MTTEIEKTFFDTFGVEPKKEYYCPNCETKLEKWYTPKGMQYICGNDSECDYFLDSYDEEFKEILNNLDFRLAYPQITDRILLKLICILSEWRTYLHSSYTIKANNTLNLKQDVLKDFLELFKWYEFKKCEKGIKHQVQALFKEG